MKSYRWLTRSIFKNKREYDSKYQSAFHIIRVKIVWWGSLFSDVCMRVCFATEIVFLTLSDGKKKKKLENTAVCRQKDPGHTLSVPALQWATASSKPPNYPGSIKLTVSANFTRHRIVSIGPRRCQSVWYTVNYISPHLDLTFQYMTSSTPPDYFIIIIFYLRKSKKIKLLRQQLHVLATAVDEQWEGFYRAKDVHAFIHLTLTEYFLSVLRFDRERSMVIVYAEFSHIHRTS